MSNSKQCFLSWMHGYVPAGDLIITPATDVLLFDVTSSITYNPGLLFNPKSSIQTIWEVVVLTLLLIRRWQLQIEALLCVALALAHLILGPCLLGTDTLVSSMLYSITTYGNPKNTKAFIILASTIGLLVLALAAWTITSGLLLIGGRAHTWSSWNDSNSNGTMTTGGTLGSIYTGTFISEAANMVTQYMLTLAPTFEIHIISTVVVALQQRVRLTTVRMMRERNEAIAARDQNKRDTAALTE